MSLCRYCYHYDDADKRCNKLPYFIRPTGQDVVSCNRFLQFQFDYCDITYRSADKKSIVGTCTRPIKKVRKKNQINFVFYD